MSSFTDLPLSSRVVELPDEDEDDGFLDCAEGPVTESVSPTVVASSSSVQQANSVDQYLSEDMQKKLHTFDSEDEPCQPPLSGDVEHPLAAAFAVEKDLARAISEKERGNDYFRNKDYDNAIQCYSLAIDFCPTDSEHAEQLATFYGNRSAAYAADEEWDQVIEDCTSAVELKPDYVKVFVRRMQAHEKLDKIDEALSGLHASALDLTIFC
jgi:tetratricopeptide (TPR) repeat protein